MASKPEQHTTARDFFSHLLSISMLYVGVISFLALLFQYINVGFPDELDYYIGSLDIIRNSMASLMVVWPVYILISWFIRKDMMKTPAKAGIWVRKWLMYLTLFVSAVTIIVDLITLINNFLGGEITVRFALKVLVVLAVAAGVFWYFLWDLREEGALKSKAPKIAAIASSAIIIVSIIGGFFLVGTPGQQRQARLDMQRVNDLSSIQSEVVSYWTRNGELPASLNAISSDLTYFQIPTDPISGEAYLYRVKSDLNFELCATFSTEDDGEGLSNSRYSYLGTGLSETFAHGVGETCFSRTINPDLYPKPTTP